MRKFIFVVTASMFLLPGICSADESARYQVKAGQPYETVRIELIGHGYQPVHLKHSKSDSLCQGSGVCERYPEVIDCAGTGVNPCSFAFTRMRDRKYFIVFTHGEERLIVDQMLEATENEVKDIRGHQ